MPSRTKGDGDGANTCDVRMPRILVGDAFAFSFLLMQFKCDKTLKSHMKGRFPEIGPPICAKLFRDPHFCVFINCNA